jgi:hypothetical protein
MDDTKSKVLESTQGFSFLGYQIINIFKNSSNRVKIYPSRISQKELITTVGGICKKFRSISTFSLIELLRPKILKWANYFKYVECKKVFKKLD